jgi:tetratricopeptide (TPR) repeat protein
MQGLTLGSLYKTQGRYAEAEPLLQRALAIEEQFLGPHHPDVARVLKSYASLLRAMERTEEALAHEERARHIRAQAAP